ncbi:MAG: response regulator [Thaumarchaeota archaeon]|nr:MAG: response regulator [Nitrososphaerota archaeon]TLX94951.1 MAG: response regulator [Nitrososphaerota archaeon]
MIRVMIADDSDSIRMVLRDILEIGKHELVGEATNGSEAIELFIETKPEILLLDMAMPKKDGLAALREIIKINPKAKIIMITATDNQNTIRDCISAGARAYILKPFNFQDVLKTITEVVNS